MPGSSRDAGTLVTRPAERGILRGVTRTTLFDLARRDGIIVEERPFSVAEAKAAREAFVTAATTLIMPVVKIDDTLIGDGKPGPLATSLRRNFHAMAEGRPDAIGTHAAASMPANDRESFACAGLDPRRL